MYCEIVPCVTLGSIHITFMDVELRTVSMGALIPVGIPSSVLNTTSELAVESITLKDSM